MREKFAGILLMRTGLLALARNKIIKFIIRLILFLIVLIAADSLLGTAINHFYKKTLYGQNWPKVNVLTSNRFDIIIFGSSRTFRHYVPTIIEKETGLSTFNAGENGQYLLYAYALEQLVLQKYTPRVIILDILPSYIVRLQDPNLEFERLNILLPHIDSPQVNGLVTRNRLTERIKTFSKLYRFNSLILSIADNYNRKPVNYDNGYVSIGTPKFRPTNKFIVDTMKPENVRIDSFKLNILKEFILSAQRKNIQVIMSFSPPLQPISPLCSQLLQKYEELFSELNVPFIKILPSEYKEFMDQKLFMDYIHMNAMGANKFSQLFARKLKSMLE